MRSGILLVHRLIFAGLCGVTLFKALEPGGASVGGLNDKVLHFLAFYVLTLSAACAAPTLRLVWMAAGLAGLGLAIEGLQRLPMVGRSASLLDWAADLAGVAAALLPALVLEWRRRLEQEPARRAQDRVGGPAARAPRTLF